MKYAIPQRILSVLEWAKSRTVLLERPGVRRAILAAATLLFFSGLLFAYQARPAIFKDLNVGAWFGVFALVPLTLIANTLQFWVTARIGGIPIGSPRALVVTVLSTAASLLPLPGGAAVRTIALSQGGNAYGSAFKLTFFVGVAWLGVASAIAATGLFSLSYPYYGLIAGLLSGSSLIVAFLGLKSARDASFRRLSALLAAQLLLAITGGLRLVLCFRALGEQVLVEQALVLLFAPVVGAFVGIAPAGLGLTELTAAGLAALISVAPAAAFVAAALNRITGLLVIAPIAVSLNFLDITQIPDDTRSEARRRPSH